MSEPVAGNYYPINAMASLDDGVDEFAVLTEVTQGGASLKDGSLEFMVHRRVQQDDSRGVAEPLDETMCGCRVGNERLGPSDCDCAGLTMRGRHWLVLDTVANANKLRRSLSERQNFGPTLAFGPGGMRVQRESFSALASKLPSNVKLQTLTNNYASVNEGKLLFRLSHLYSVGEHSELSKPVTVDLTSLFGNGYRIIDAEEMSLTGNQNKATMVKNKLVWKTSEVSSDGDVWSPPTDLQVTLRPMEVKTFHITFAQDVLV